MAAESEALKFDQDTLMKNHTEPHPAHSQKQKLTCHGSAYIQWAAPPPTWRGWRCGARREAAHEVPLV